MTTGSQYRRVVGDTESPIRDRLLVDGDAADFTDFNEVRIHIETPSGSVIEDDTTRNVSVLDASDGRVRYDFATGDLSEQGRYRYEWEVEYGGGGILTFPADGWETIYVRDELA
jgi:hypothetical protein